MKSVAPLLIIVAMISVSCNKEDNEVFEGNIRLAEMEDCLGQQTAFDFTIDTCFFDSNYICSLVELEDTFRFNHAQTSWLPFYCVGLGERIRYVDKDGNYTSIVITDKKYNINTGGYNSFEECIEGENKNIFYCINRESAWVKFYSELFNREGIISLELQFDWNEFTEKKPGASISIRTNNSALNSLLGRNDFYALVDLGELEPIGIINTNFYPEIELGGQVFYNVYTYENHFDPDFIQMYYNQDYGLVGFWDDSKELWVIDMQ